MEKSNKKYIRWWLWSGVILVFLMLIIGGITRLTGSGLSMSDWNLIMGSLPPMSESEWMAAFEQYKQFPQYQQLNMGMSLAEFKQIFFWEYLHRLWGRMLGIVFLIPALYFWIRDYFNAQLRRRVLVLFGLGALQGAMGWVMVKSGLVDIPYVSHYRLAAHLLLAIILIGFCVWFALDLRQSKAKKPISYPAELTKWSTAVGAVLLLQIIWGAFTAGLDAGYIYNSFPLMNGQWLPRKAWTLQPVITNLVENPGMVQWVHRILGTVLGILFILLWIRTRKLEVNKSIKIKADVLVGLVLVQYLLGVLTLLLHLPVALGVAHQAGAVLLCVGWLMYVHDLKKSWH